MNKIWRDAKLRGAEMKRAKTLVSAAEHSVGSKEATEVAGFERKNLLNDMDVYAHSETAAFALLFEFDGDIRKIRHVLYSCSESRPKIEGKTNEESREVQTETLTIKACPLASVYVKAKTRNKTSAETYANWYKEVYLPDPKTAEADTGGHG